MREVELLERLPRCGVARRHVDAVRSRHAAPIAVDHDG